LFPFSNIARKIFYHYFPVSIFYKTFVRILLLEKIKDIISREAELKNE